MNISLNGTPCETDATTLADALSQLGYAGATVATAVNGNFVTADARASHPINPGDQIEVLAPMQGG